MTGLKVIDGTPTEISKYLREKENEIEKEIKKIKNKLWWTNCKEVKSGEITERILTDETEVTEALEECFVFSFQFTKEKVFEIIDKWKINIGAKEDKLSWEENIEELKKEIKENEL